MSNKKDYTIETVVSSSTEWGVTQAPFSLRPFSGRIRGSCVPYIEGPKTAIQMGLRIDCAEIPPAAAQTINLPLMASASIVYQPTASQVVASLGTYTEIVSASNPDNSTPMHVGSMYLDARTYTTIGAMITDIKGGVGGSDAHIELKRFTNGSTLMSASNTSTAGPTWEYVTQSSVVVSTADWYDIYISASGNPATSSIRGIYYEY
jgi:hypothetical protein